MVVRWAALDSPAMEHALSVDVEDWFMVLNFQDRIDRSEWEKIELRCGDSSRRLLDALARRDAKATFFFLGWVAERLTLASTAGTANAHRQQGRRRREQST